MREDFVYYNHSFQFVPALLKDEKIRAEILKYQKASWKFEISFENGVFIISQIWNTEDSLEEEAARIEQVCRTAAVLHDELKRISELPR